MTWECHVDDSTDSRHGVVLSRDLLTSLSLDLKLYEDVISGGDVTYKQFL